MTSISRIIRYELCSEEPAAQHGQGAIWKATDLLFDETVAIKQVRADLQGDPSAIETFRKEAAAGARLGRLSSNIVPVHDYGCVDDELYFVMDWISGENLAKACGRISLRHALSVIRQITSAVEIAHRNGIVHSDIAPANILRHISTGQVFLSDFGYLKIVDTILISRGERSLLIGFRPYYIPNEHMLSPARINFSTDVYALALTLHSLLTGKQLNRDEGGRLQVPGVIEVKQEGRQAPDGVRQLLQRFVGMRSDDDTVKDLRDYLDRLS